MMNGILLSLRGHFTKKINSHNINGPSFIPGEALVNIQSFVVAL